MNRMPESRLAEDMHETFLEDVNAAIDRLTLGAGKRPTPAESRKGQPRYRHIVVAYDGSEGAERALAWAKELGRASGARISLVGVATQPPVTAPDAMGLAWYPSYAEAFHDAERSLEECTRSAADLLRESDLQADSVVLEGGPGREIARYADETSADLVIVGETRGGRVKRALLGSTAQTLLDRAPCSVLIARGDPRPARILACADGSHASYRAVAHALHRASQSGAELVIQHVLDYPTQRAGDVPPAGFAKEVVERLQLPAAPPKVRYVLDVGAPATRILLRAGEEGAGLVVLGSHGKEAVERLLVGSTSRRVANESHASVLVVKDPR